MKKAEIKKQASLPWIFNFRFSVFLWGLYPRFDIPKMELAQCLTDAQAEFFFVCDSQR